MIKKLSNIIYKLIVFLLVGVLFFACDFDKNNQKSRILGQWAIEEISYTNKSYKDNLYSNVLIFKDNNVVSIPESVHFDKDLNSKWDLILVDNKELLNIRTTNIVFNDTFVVDFIEDKERKLRGIVLTSDTIHIKAFKLLQNYDNW